MTRSLEFVASRIVLIGADAALLSAELQGRQAFAETIDGQIPESWPPEHHDTNVIRWVLNGVQLLSPTAPWRMFYIALTDSRTLIGTCGFKGPPDANGCTEVGYSVVPEYRAAGYATEAVLQLITIAFENGASSVAAETYPSLAASLRVMEKCGMKAAGEGSDLGTVRYAISRI